MIDMTSYVLEMSDGSVSEWWFPDDESAVATVETHLADMYDVDEVIVADQWDSKGRNDDGEPMERILFWLSEEDAENDNGAKSIAQLTVVREGE